MGQDSLTSSGSMETGTALPGEHEIEFAIPSKVEDIGLSGPKPTSNLVLPRGLSKPVQRDPMQALHFAI